jgi:hypothetical protein
VPDETDLLTRLLPTALLAYRDAFERGLTRPRPCWRALAAKEAYRIFDAQASGKAPVSSDRRPR